MRVFKKFIQCSIAFKGVLDDGGGEWYIQMVGEKSIESDCCRIFLHNPIATKPQIVETQHSKGHGMIFFCS